MKTNRKKFRIIVGIYILILMNIAGTSNCAIIAKKDNTSSSLAPKISIEIKSLQQKYLDSMRGELEFPKGLFGGLKIQEEKRQGWVVPKFYDLSQSLDKWEQIRNAFQQASSGEVNISPLLQIISREEMDYLVKGTLQRGKALVRFLQDIYAGNWEVVRDGIVPESVVRKALRTQGYEQLVGKLSQEQIMITYGPDLSYHNGYVIEDNIGSLGGREFIVTLQRELLKIFPNAPLFDYELLVKRYEEGLKSILPSEDTIVSYWDDPVFKESRAFKIDSWRQNEKGIVYVDSANDQARHFEVSEGNGLFVVSPEGTREKVGLLDYNEYDLSLDPDYPIFAQRMRELGLNKVSEGIPGIMSLVLNNKIVLGHHPGSSLADSKLIYPFVEKFIRYYLKEEPIFKTTKTFALTDKYGMQEYTYEEAIRDKENLVLKPIMGKAGEGVVVGKFTSEEKWKKQLKEAFNCPEDFLLFEFVELMQIRDRIMVHRIIAKISPELKTVVYPGVYVREKSVQGDGVIWSSESITSGMMALVEGVSGKDIYPEDVSIPATTVKKLEIIDIDPTVLPLMQSRGREIIFQESI
ncbi:MAG: circularly permuted type 2 ATP-grasp protein [Candidatus Omnitrophica bacterium]|nr:circularly permuted type 2 ATP-grasp protein [Candidatus Omnitrophota bacterium]